MPQFPKFSFTSPKTGKQYDFDWTNPGQPTAADFKNLELEVEKLEAGEEKPSLVSRAKQFAKDTVSGLAHMGKTSARIVTGDMSGIPDMLDIGKGMIEPLTSNAPEYSGHPATRVAGMFGFPVKNIKEDYAAGNYGALAGDILPPIALEALSGAAGAGATKLLRGKKPQLPPGPKTLPDIEVPPMSEAIELPQVQAPATFESLIKPPEKFSPTNVIKEPTLNTPANTFGPDRTYPKPVDEPVIKKGRNYGISDRDFLADNPVMQTVPDRLRPEAPNVTRIREALPARTRELIEKPIKAKEKVEFVSDEPTPPEKIKKDVEKNAKRVGLKDEQVNEAVTKATENQAIWKKAWDQVATARVEQLRQLGDAGKEIADLITSHETGSRQLGGEYSLRFDKAFRELSKPEQSRLIKILDGQEKMTYDTPINIQNAYNQVRSGTKELGESMEKSGVHLKVGPGESIPFKMMEGEYFPRNYPPDFWDARKPDIYAKLTAEGIAPEEISKIIENAKMFGESYLSPQHARTSNIPGYLEDPRILRQYAYDVTERVSRAEKFGVRDIGDAKSPISQLIAKTTNPEKATKLLTEYFDRGTKHPDWSYKVADKVTKFEVATKLSQFALNNMTDVATLPVATDIRSSLKGIAQTVFDYSKSKDIAMESGNLAILQQEALHDIGMGSKLSKIYGINTVEEFLRTTQAMTGRAYVKSLFKDLKAKPADVTLRARFGRFVDGDIDSILKQDELTPTQIKQASGRTSELSASVPTKSSLPPGFTDVNPILRVPLLFKRFAVSTTRNLKNTIMNEPTHMGKVQKAGTALLAYAIAGEAVGDLKAVANGLVSHMTGDDKESITEKVAKRGSENLYSTGYAPADRMIANAMQSWLFGILGEAGEAVTHGAKGVAGFLGGPVLGDVMEGADLAKGFMDESMRPGGDYKSEGKRLLQSGARRIPFVGPGINQGLKKKEGKGSQYAPSLPNIKPPKF